MWLCHHYEQYFVALDETKIHLEKLGIPANKVTVTGIPVDPAFAKLLTTWTSEYRDGNADTQDMIALAEKISGQQLGEFFQAWLYGTSKPTY